MSVLDLPVYGPTDPHGDEEHEPDVIVRVDFLMSREQITTALGIAWAEIAGDRSPESLTVLEVRHEVEAWLSVQAFHTLDVQMERDAARTWPPEQQRIMQLLADFVARAYPPRSDPEQLPMQRPRYGDGTVTLDTVDRGEVTVDEPAWCTGHDGESVGHFTDITHNGPDIVAPIVTAKYGASQIMTAHISHAPHADAQPEPFPLLAVELDGRGDLDPADVHALARALRLAATRIDRAAANLEQIRRGQQ
ncbi:hypothetical protein TUSST3_76790 [Streptomyces sp. TUS-ST3]|uniref:DUF6907 domain-containing protein n=1 Tax=Streptomyces sp. TUS-ST3 TaxID=3025591 RepID=UPI00235B3F0F|nr:hypothetical protein [Streptomyces sp. TUS-ST3]GLP71059.1 hypothetical protein TUSST3_76790 [Streptomyces sp. TUS-ST3]